MDKPTHLEPVPEGGVSFQQMAEATDEAVFGMMSELRGSHPGLGGAIVAGTAGGLARYQLQGMPDGASGQQVLEVLAPIIRSAAMQIAAGLRKAKGLPEPKVAVVAPIQGAFDRLTGVLSNAPFPTFCIRQEDHLLLVSAHVTPAGVLTHGSVANISAATLKPAEVLAAHCTMAARSWTGAVPTTLLGMARAKLAEADAKLKDDQTPSRDWPALEAEIEALQWVVEQFGIADEPEGESHDGQT